MFYKVVVLKNFAKNHRKNFGLKANNDKVKAYNFFKKGF